MTMMRRLRPAWRRLALAFVLAVPALPAPALELQWSGFGTLGYAQSNRPYAWQRSVTDEGSFERDTVMGLQADLRLSTEWSATVQARLAQDGKKDGAWSPTIAWAFVAWRPDNDWLLRAGRFRVPMFLFSETQDIGTAHDMAQLPNDSYSLNPTSDFNGLYGTHTWQIGARELSADLYAGRAGATYRYWLQDGVPGLVAPGPLYNDVQVRAKGLVLTLRDPALTMRLGVHQVHVRSEDYDVPAANFPYVDLGNGLGYWQVTKLLPGPGLETTDSVRVKVYVAGADWNVDGRWRVIGEAVVFEQDNTAFGVGGKAGYLNVSRRIGKFTPYVTISRTLSAASQREWAQRLRNVDLPAAVPGAAMINATQRMAADTTVNWDHRSLALGASYALAPNVKLKGEWMRTRIGAGTGSASLLPGMAYPSHSRIDVLSLNLNFDF